MTRRPARKPPKRPAAAGRSSTNARRPPGSPRGPKAARPAARGPASKRRPATKARSGAARGHRPRKRFGQHFLAPAWARRVVDALEVTPGDVFLEIGPGTGALTFPLADTGAPILAVEIDRTLIEGLLERVPAHVTVMAGDFLQIDVLPFLSGLQPNLPPEAAGAPAVRRTRVVGNLPYYIASPILFRLLELQRRHGVFADATVMVQKEVANRLVARPGVKDYGVLTVMLGLFARIERVLELPPGAFTPRPKVASTVVRLTFGPPVVRIRDERLFERMVKALFSQRRKTLNNALKAFDPTAPAVLALARIDGQRRPETLDLPELARLAELFASVRQPPML